MAEKSRKQRSPLDPVFKQVLVDEFAGYQAALQTEVEVGRLPRKIDAVLTVEAEEERQKICAETPFFYCTKHNQVEFKGRRDRLTEAGYHIIDGRKHFLVSERKVSALELTVTIICAGKPQAVLTYAQQLQRPFMSVADGYYKREGHPPIYLIVINELPIIPKNYPLLLFASSDRKFREFLEQVVGAGNSTYIRYAYEVRPKVTKEVLTMAGISTTLSREDLEFMAEDIGPELVPFLKPKDLLQGMDREKQREFISLLSPQEILATISMEDLLKGISPEQRKTLLELMLKTLASGFSGQSKSEG
jgi:hypothetical protein